MLASYRLQTSHHRVETIHLSAWSLSHLSQSKLLCSWLNWACQLLKVETVICLFCFLFVSELEVELLLVLGSLFQPAILTDKKLKCVVHARKMTVDRLLCCALHDFFTRSEWSLTSHCPKFIPGQVVQLYWVGWEEILECSKPFVGNRVSAMVDKIPPDRWHHVISADNPTDCASRGIFPFELIHYRLWWTGPPWLSMKQSYWPQEVSISAKPLVSEEREVCYTSVSLSGQPVIPFERHSTFIHIQWVVAWILQFANNHKKLTSNSRSPVLTVTELAAAEIYLVRFSQETHFAKDIASLEARHDLSRKSNLLLLNPFIDSNGVLQVGGRKRNSKLPYSQMHPMILHGKHVLTRLIIRSEHIRLLHAGLILLLFIIFTSLAWERPWDPLLDSVSSAVVKV